MAEVIERRVLNSGTLTETDDDLVLLSGETKATTVQIRGRLVVAGGTLSANALQMEWSHDNSTWTAQLVISSAVATINFAASDSADGAYWRVKTGTITAATGSPTVTWTVSILFS